MVMRNFYQIAAVLFLIALPAIASSPKAAPASNALKINLKSLAGNYSLRSDDGSGSARAIYLANYRFSDSPDSYEVLSFQFLPSSSTNPRPIFNLLKGPRGFILGAGPELRLSSSDLSSVANYPSDPQTLNFDRNENLRYRVQINANEVIITSSAHVCAFGPPLKCWSWKWEDAVYRFKRGEL